MAFESVDAGELETAISNCRREINYGSTNDIIHNISNDNVWNTKSRNSLKRRLERLVQEKYSELEGLLNTYGQVPGLIREYKSLESANESYYSQIHSLQSEIDNATDETYIVQSGDTLSAIARSQGVSVDAIVDANDIENANRISVGQVLTIPGGVDTSGLEAEISSLRSKIEDNLNRMREIENQVDSII